jgi:hypothetical protein
MADLFLSGTWRPALELQTQGIFRTGCGVLLLATLLLALPHWRRFFLSEGNGGYIVSSRLTDALGRPRVAALLLALWVVCALLLIVGRLTVLAAAVNLAFCHYFFIRLRWRSTLRGMGAPGFMTYWLACAVLVLEVATRYAPSVRPLALLAVQVDLALIFLSAGIYKLLAGYRANDGVDLGLVNPQWGYWWRLFRRSKPDNAVFRGLNQLGWLTEIVAGILMLIPPTRFLGGAIIALTFVLIRVQVRLGVLCEAVIVATIVFFHPGSAGAKLLDAVFGWLPAATTRGDDTAIAPFLTVLICVYLALLPLAHVGLGVNLYRRRALPGRLQRALELWTGTFGIVVWRVFTADVVDFFVLIYSFDDDDNRTLLSRWGWRHGLRYAHVGEAIAVTSVFTTLRYFPGRPQLFDERLLRYARTLPDAETSRFIFEIVGVIKEVDRFEYVPLSEFVVVPRTGAVSETLLSDRGSIHAPHGASPVHEGTRPGSYSPAAT